VIKRSYINDLQNGVILLIFKLERSQSIHFVGNLILNVSCFVDKYDLTSSQHHLLHQAFRNCW